MFWGLMQIWWLGKAEPLYGEAGAKAPASLNFLLDKVSDQGIAPLCSGNTGPVLDLVFRTSSTMCGALSCSFGAADKAPHWSAECSENQARPLPAVTRLRAACDGAVAGWGRWADVGARGCCGP